MICREFHDRISEGQTLENLALLWKAREDVNRALPFAHQAVAALEQTEDTAELAKARQILARLEQS